MKNTTDGLFDFNVFTERSIKMARDVGTDITGELKT